MNDSVDIPATQREKDIINLLARSCSNKEIAVALGITEGTVKVYVHHMLVKFGLNRYNLIRVALRDHERGMAIRLNNWIETWKGLLTPKSLDEIKLIMADQVAEILTPIAKKYPYRPARRQPKQEVLKW